MRRRYFIWLNMFFLFFAVVALFSFFFRKISVELLWVSLGLAAIYTYAVMPRLRKKSPKD